MFTVTLLVDEMDCNGIKVVEMEFTDGNQAMGFANHAITATNFRIVIVEEDKGTYNEVVFAKVCG